MKKNTPIEKAAFILRQNKVVAIPTETVYGLAASIFNETAIQSIYKIKNRPSNNPLIVHIKSADELDKYTQNIPLKARLLVENFWPGPLTLVLQKSELIPEYITSGKDTVAIRVPNHPVTLKLLERISFPLAAPSANPSNAVSATSAQHVLDYFGSKIPYILDGGECTNGLESTIIGFEEDIPVVYRLGSLTIEKIEAVIGKVNLKNNPKNSPIAPGMFSKHYSPKTPLILVENLNEYLEKCDFLNIAYLGFNTSIEHPKIKQNYLLSEHKKVEEAASKLYQTLIEIDKLNFDVILTTYFPEEELGKSINDRLKRASVKN